MKYLFICYSKCSTCNNARALLKDKSLDFSERDIKENNPSYEELDTWSKDKDLKKFFNTSGLVYRKLGLKDKLSKMTREEQLELLASDGMLVKRPILIGENIIIGFDKEKYEQLK